MARVGFITFHGISFPVSDSTCSPLFCLSGYSVWYLANPTATAAPAEIGQAPSATEMSACKSAALHWLSEGLAGPGEPLPTTEMILLYPFPTPNPVLSLMTPTEMQWAKVSLNF